MQALETKAELRKAHFKFGEASPKETFQTTNQENDISKGEYQLIKESLKNIGHADHIVYGKDRVPY
jgi:hypothetical protein